jgi:hypothetical protein
MMQNNTKQGKSMSVLSAVCMSLYPSRDRSPGAVKQSSACDVEGKDEHATVPEAQRQEVAKLSEDGEKQGLAEDSAVEEVYVAEMVLRIPEDVHEKQKKRNTLRRLLMWAVTIPCVIGGCLWLLGTYGTQDYITDSLDEHLWRNFSAHVRQTVKAFDSKYPHNVLLVLCVVHALQVLLCFPLLHVTKMMYGYFFGALNGGIVCACWELGIVMLFVVAATQNTPVRSPARELMGFLMTVGALRAQGWLLPFMVALQVSSVPLVTSTCLVLFRVVSRWEFLLAHTISTVLMTSKDTWLGHFLATSDGNARNIAIAAMLLSFSALLPTATTVCLMWFVTSRNIAGKGKPQQISRGQLVC